MPGFFNGNTYTDFHELNLDYWIKLVKGFQEQLDAIDITGMKEDIAENATNISDIKSKLVSVDNLISGIQDDISTLNTDLSTFKEDIYSDLQTTASLLEDTLKAYSDAKDTALRVDILGIVLNYVHAIEAQIDAINEQLDDIPNKIHVYNEFSGKKECINDVLKDYAKATKLIHGLTVAEYDAFALTVNQYAAYLLTTMEYAVKAKLILNHYYNLHTNPLTGAKHTTSNIASWIMGTIYNGYSVDGYDDLELTADDYDAAELTVLDYMKVKGHSGYVDTSGNGLTVNEYGSLGISI